MKNTISTILFAILAASSSISQSKNLLLEYTIIDDTIDSSILEETCIIAKNKTEFKELWLKHIGFTVKKMEMSHNSNV